MSKNPKISKISQNIFESNSKYLLNKKSKEIKLEQESFESKLEGLTNELDESIRKAVLSRMVKESENDSISFFDSNGSINIYEVRRFVNSTAEKVKKDEMAFNIEAGNGEKKTSLDNQRNNAENTKLDIEKMLDIYKNLSDKEKDDFLRNILNLDKDTPAEVLDVYKLQMELLDYVKEQIQKGKSIDEIQASVNKDKRFKGLTKAQLTIGKNGRTLLEEQIELTENAKIIEERIKDANDTLKKPDISQESRAQKQKRLEELEKELEELKKQIENISKKTKTVKEAERDGAEEREKNGESEALLDMMQQSKDEKQDGAESVDIGKIKSLEEIRDLLDKGISEGNIAGTKEIFKNILLELKDGSSKKQFQKMVADMQEGATPETIPILDTMFSMELKNEKQDGAESVDIGKIKSLEDIRNLLDKGISRENIAGAIEIFNYALLELEDGSSKKQLQEMITEMQEGASPEVIAILEVLPNIEFDRDLDEILSSDEYIMELANQLSEFSENLQVKEEESQEQDQTPIADQEFKSSEQVTFEEMVVGEQPDRSQESGKIEGETHLEQSDTERKESVTVFMPLTSIMKSTVGVKTSNIRDEKNMLAKLTQENVLTMEGNSI